MRDRLKAAIVDVVTETQGCKATELPSAIVLRLGIVFTASELIWAVEELVGKGELVALEYRLPDMPYRTKMFLLPAHTRTNLASHHERY